MRLRLTVDGADAIVELGTAGPAMARYGLVEVRLVELAPYPSGDRVIEPDDYRLTLRIVGQGPGRVSRPAGR